MIHTIPPGSKVRVGRRWRPWNRRSQMVGPRYFDGADPLSNIDDSAAFVAMVIVVLVVSILPLIVASVAFVAELIVIAVVAPLFVVGRIVLHKPWTVEATRSVGLLQRDLIYSEPVMGWRASGERVRELRGLLRDG